MSDQIQDQNIALRLNDIEKAFSQGKGKLHVLKGASLEIKQGEMVALVGPRVLASQHCLILLVFLKALIVAQ